MRPNYRIAVSIALGLLLGGMLFGCGGGGGGGGNTLRINTSRGPVLQDAVWLAVQDGSAAWSQLLPSAAGRYMVDLADPSGKYGVAIVAVEDGDPVVRILQMTRADGMEWDLSVGDPDGASITLQPLGVPASASWRGSMWSSDRATQGSFPVNLDSVPRGNRDCLAALYPQGLTNPPSKMIVHRNHGVVGDHQTVDLDFNAAEAFAPQMFSIEAPGGALGTIIYTNLRTSNGAMMRTGQVATSGRYAALPANKRASGDLYIAWGGEEVLPNKVRLATQIFRTPGDKILTLPTIFGSASVSRALPASLSLRALWNAYAGAGLYEVKFEHEGNRSRALSSRDWEVYLSPQWLDGTDAYITPDLRAVSGWNQAWNLDPATAIEWTVGAYRANVGPVQLLSGLDKGFLVPLADGANSSYSAVIGHYRP